MGHIVGLNVSNYYQMEIKWTKKPALIFGLCPQQRAQIVSENESFTQIEGAAELPPWRGNLSCDS